jgi:hypothetical protein
MTRIQVLAVMTADVGDTVISIIEAVLEDLNRLAGNDGTPHPANEFFSFSAEHTAADDLDPATMMAHHVSSVCKRKVGTTTCAHLKTQSVRLLGFR